MAGTVTVASGLRNVEGDTYTRATWDTPEALASILAEADEPREGWWSPHVFRGSRHGDNWVQACAVAMDVEGPTKQAGLPLPEPLLEELHARWRDGEIPGSVLHATRSGARVLFAFPAPLRSRDLWLQAHAGARELTRRAFGPEWEVDAAVANLANLNWLPNTVDERGRSRSADVLYRDRLYPPAELARVEHEGARAPERPEQPSGSVDDRRKAVESLLMLGADVAQGYEAWIEVGQVLHVVYGASQTGLDLWHAWSKQAGNYDARALDRRWDGFKSAGRGLGSLIHLARSMGRPQAWEGGAEMLAEMGLHDLTPSLSLVDAPADDDLEDWAARSDERGEGEAQAASPTFRGARFRHPRGRAWYLEW